MTDEKKTGETSETPYPGTLSWAATRLLEAICDAAKAVAEMLWESRRRRALARSRRNNLYLKSIGRCR